MKNGIRSGCFLFLAYFLYPLSADGQSTFKKIDGCLCFYLNRLRQHDNYLNFGLYDTSVLKSLNEPSKMVDDSIMFFSAFKNKRILLDQRVVKYHMYDVPDLEYVNYYNVIKRVRYEQRVDSVQIINSIVLISRKIVEKFNFDIVSWMDRRPFYDSPQRISKKRGIYIKCRRIDATWYLVDYPTLKNKLADLELNINREDPEFIKEVNRTIRISYKDSTTIAYPIILW